MAKGEEQDAFADNEMLGHDSDCGSPDVGVSMCGTMVMSDAVRDAVRKEEGVQGQCGPCSISGRTPVALCPEVFELQHAV